MNTILEKTVAKPVILQAFNFQLDREGTKEREDGERGGVGGQLFERCDYFKYFGQRGAIIRGTAIIRKIYGF